MKLTKLVGPSRKLAKPSGLQLLPGRQNFRRNANRKVAPLKTLGATRKQESTRLKNSTFIDCKSSFVVSFVVFSVLFQRED